MLKKSLLPIVLLALASCASVKKHNASLGNTYSPDELRKDIDFTYKKFQKLQPKLYQYVSKEVLDRKFDSLKKSITRPLNAKEFYMALSPVVAEIRQGHIIGDFPDRRFSKKETNYLKNTKLDFFDLELKFIEDGFWISGTGPKDSVLIGSQLVAVGMETTAELVKKYCSTFSSDGYNSTFQSPFIANNFTAAYSKHEGYRDSVSLILMKHDSVFVKHFKRYLKDSSFLKPRSIDSTKIVQRPRLTKAQKKAEKVRRKQLKKRNRKYGFIPARNRFTRNFKFLDSTAQIGYFKIRSWNNGSHEEFFEESFAKLDSAKAQYLIIDIRDNPGGNLDQIHDFYGYLTDTSYQFVRPGEVKTRLPNIKKFYGRNSNLFSVVAQTAMLPYFLIDNLTKTRKTEGRLQYHFKESKTTKPKPLNFKGKIYVLVNGGSFSASTTLASQLHGNKRALFIGEETGGAYNGTVAGQFKIITLPHSKLAFQLGLMQLETPQRQEPDGFGIKPDIIVSPTVADFLADRDTELHYVLDMIKHGKQ